MMGFRASLSPHSTLVQNRITAPARTAYPRCHLAHAHSRASTVCHSASDRHGYGNYGSDDMAGDELDQALSEALELFNQATTMSTLQVQAELQQAFEADEPSGNMNTDNAAPQALLNFWVEQGLSTNAAGALLAEIRASGRSYTMHQLSSKVQRLQRVLPDADIATLACKDPHVLDADINTALMNMISLVEAFPGKDIMTLLARQPRLLWCNDIRERIPRVFNKLRDLHPSKDLSVVGEIIAENPELLFRMDYYMDAMMLDYLPIEIQNMMVLTGQGIGFLYRYYKNKNTNYQAEIYRNDFDQ